MKTINTEVLNGLVIHLGDADIKFMLAENGISMEVNLNGPNDTITTRLIDARSNYEWLVYRFLDPDDPGYAAYGLPLSTPREQRDEGFAEIFQMVAETAQENTGQNPFLYAQFIPQTGEAN